MANTDPPSPAPSHATQDDLQSGFQQLIQHNNAPTPTSYPQEQHHHQQQQVNDYNSHMGSNPNSRYPSPAPHQSQQQHHGLPVYDHSSPYAAQYQTFQSGYPMEPSPYPQLPDLGPSNTPHNAYSTPATSPPTPLQNDAMAMTTRSGRAVTRSHGTPALGPRTTRIEKASPKPKAKKAKRKKGGKLGTLEPAMSLDAPLSELVAHITTVHDTNIGEYVTRSIEQRREEVRGSKDNKIKRPMNAFMLYRKAYQNRTKEWKKHDNHQVISQVCGTSWNMEPQPLRDQYDDWAKVERANHKIAFPEYKFAPAKAKNRKVVKEDRASDDEGSDLEGYVFDAFRSHPPSRNASRAARSSIYDPDGDYRPTRGAYSQYSQSPVAQQQHPSSRIPFTAQQQHHQSSFQYSNPGKPRPAEYGHGLAPHQYYQQSSEFTQPHYPHHLSNPYVQPAAPAFIENVYMSKADSPAASSSSFHGSPIDHHYGDMTGSAYPPPQAITMAPHHSQIHLQHQNHHQQQLLMTHTDEQQIDPSLMPPQPGGHDGGYDGLGILNLDQTMPDFQDGLQQYPLEHGLGHPDDDGQHPQQFEQAYHPNDGGEEWREDPAAGPMSEAKLGDDWEALGEGGEFQLEDIDDILGTTDSPGG